MTDHPIKTVSDLYSVISALLFKIDRLEEKVDQLNTRTNKGIHTFGQISCCSDPKTELDIIQDDCVIFKCKACCFQTVYYV